MAFAFMDHTSVVASFVPSQMVQEPVLQASSELFFHDQTLLKRKVVISSYSAAGLGDLVAGATMASFLRSQRFAAENITVCVRHPSEMHLFRHLIGASAIVSKEQALAIHDVAMHIMMPVPVSLYIPEYLATKKPVLVISEYGAVPYNNTLLPPTHFRAKALGLDREKGELGIFINEELVRWSQIPERDNLLLKEAELYKLPSLLQSLLTRGFSSASEFLQNTSVYFGYVSEVPSAVAFLLAIAALSTKDTVVVVLPRLDPHKTKEFLRARIAEYAVYKVTFSTYQGASGSSWVLFNSRGPDFKNISIISGSFHFNDIISLLKLSESETIATGDQSISLALSSGKNVVYEARPNKRSFAEQLKRLYGPDIAFFVTPNDMSDIERQTEVYRRHFLLNRADGGAHLREVHGRVCREYDCRAPLAAEMEEMYRAWIGVQGRPLPFVSLCKKEEVDFVRDIPFDIPTILSSDQAGELESLSGGLTGTQLESEDHIGFTVVRRHNLLREPDRRLQEASSEHRDLST